MHFLPTPERMRTLVRRLQGRLGRARLRRPMPAGERVLWRKRIVGPDMLPAEWGVTSAAVPSIVRVPDWVERPLGRYYLYLGAHMAAPDIRLFVADAIDGPWRIQQRPALAPQCSPPVGHVIAAPDVHIDSERRGFRMYFHTGNWRDGVRAATAFSRDGLIFTPEAERIGPFYFRAFRLGDAWYAVSKGGRLHRSPDGIAPFTSGPDLFPRVLGTGPFYNTPGSIRHVAVEVCDESFDVFHTRIGDAPERILKSRVATGGPWQRWRAGRPEEVLAPAEEWEGARVAVVPSAFGPARTPVNELRDPEIFTDADGARYLLYTFAGEQGVGLARLAPR